MDAGALPIRPDGIRFRVWIALPVAPTTARALSETIGLPYKTVVDALYALHVHELVEREGRKASARWRAQTPAEASAGARRRANAREWGAGAGGEA